MGAPVSLSKGGESEAQPVLAANAKTESAHRMERLDRIIMKPAPARALSGGVTFTISRLSSWARESL